MQEQHRDPRISPYDDNCQGSVDPNRYCVALNVSAAKVATRFSHMGSSMLDGICAFDLAEIQRMNLGQLNLIKVSSFCGPEGLIWGLDIAVHASLRANPLLTLEREADSIPVYDGEPLVDAAAALYGSVKDKKFPIMPGSHTKAAYKTIVERGPVMLYAACGVGIPVDRTRCAATLMEDVGTISHELPPDEKGSWKGRIVRAVAESVAQVFENQQVKCKEIFVLFASIEVDSGEIGCAMSVAPYFSLAGKAVPNGDLEGLRSLSIDRWKEAVS